MRRLVRWVREWWCGVRFDHRPRRGVRVTRQDYELNHRMIAFDSCERCGVQKYVAVEVTAKQMAEWGTSLRDEEQRAMSRLRGELERRL